MSYPGLLERLKALLDTTKPVAEEEFLRRSYAVLIGDGDGIYYDPINGLPARAMGANTGVAAAGNFSFVQLWNPANSGIDAVVQDAWVQSVSTGQVVQVRANTAALGATGGGVAVRRDFRSLPAVTCSLRSGNEAAASGALCGWVYAPANTPVLLDLDICLGPQNGVHLEGDTANVALRVMFRWRENTPDRRRRT